MSKFLETTPMVGEATRQMAKQYATELILNEPARALLILVKYQVRDAEWLLKHSLEKSNDPNFMSYTAQEVQYQVSKSHCN